MSKIKAKSQRAPMGFALIARDAEQTLGKCLDSIRPYVEQIVVCVDSLTKDKTAKVARKHGADVVDWIDVSEWHECPQHGRVLAQHFANARQKSFARLDPSLPWIGWIDSDDVLERGEKLAELLASAPEHVIGYWIPYRYATMGNGAVTNTLFQRERILRTTRSWEWEARVHEVVKPDRQGAWISTDTVSVWHQEGAHKSENSARRNLLLLEIDLESDPNDARAWFYMGNQFFAMGEWESAISAYERLLQIGVNPYERWQAAVYESIAFEKLGDLNGATQAAHVALDERPEHPEPYFRLASISLLASQFDKVAFWTKLGRQMQPPPFFVFSNPMDYTYNNRMALADALAAEGNVKGAREELEQAYAVFPDERVRASIDRYLAIEAAERHASGFVQMAAGKDDLRIAALWQMAELPETVKAFGRVRDLVMPALLRTRPTTQPRIVFWCGRSYEEWWPGSLNGSGIGGSETAVIEIGKRFAQAGWRVDVYNGAGSHEGIHDGVGYWNLERWNFEQGDVLVTWRQPSVTVESLAGAFRTSVLWLHDLNFGPMPDGALRDFFAVVGVSQWHAAMLHAYYGVDAGYVPNGIDLARFAEPVKKVPMRCVYASSADRGLTTLLALWPRIRATEPGAELHVAYGWETFDKMAQQGRVDPAFKTAVMAQIARTEGVVYCGRLPQNELATLYQESYASLYPTAFTEVSCISMMEAMAGGCVPVTSRVAALPETLGEKISPYCSIPGMPHSSPWQDFYVKNAVGILTSPDVRRPLEFACRERAKELTWDIAFKDYWQPLVTRLLEGTPQESAAPERSLVTV